ncbi:hypothetical protein J6590_075439 [Homalodisca vitripennis]|nr:hypothetical protein J6590_075439 [Homalodisca vitripennis]
MESQTSACAVACVHSHDLDFFKIIPLVSVASRDKIPSCANLASVGWHGPTLCAMSCL